VDNSLEAGARHIDVVFERAKPGKGQRADSVSAVAFIDDGAGMTPLMARFALTWGGGT
jgi:DNA mismatch repair ATPase MutL